MCLPAVSTRPVLLVPDRLLLEGLTGPASLTAFLRAGRNKGLSAGSPLHPSPRQHKGRVHVLPAQGGAPRAAGQHLPPTQACSLGEKGDPMRSGT